MKTCKYCFGIRRLLSFSLFLPFLAKISWWEVMFRSKRLVLPILTSGDQFNSFHYSTATSIQTRVLRNLLNLDYLKNAGLSNFPSYSTNIFIHICINNVPISNFDFCPNYGSKIRYWPNNVPNRPTFIHLLPSKGWAFEFKVHKISYTNSAMSLCLSHADSSNESRNTCTQLRVRNNIK